MRNYPGRITSSLIPLQLILLSTLKMPSLCPSHSSQAQISRNNPMLPDGIPSLARRGELRTDGIPNVDASGAKQIDIARILKVNIARAAGDSRCNSCACDAFREQPGDRRSYNGSAEGRATHDSVVVVGNS